jgi:hypothetical protein
MTLQNEKTTEYLGQQLLKQLLLFLPLMMHNVKLEAGEITGLKVMRIINEPTAAACSLRT